MSVASEHLEESSQCSLSCSVWCAEQAACSLWFSVFLFHLYLDFFLFPWCQFPVLLGRDVVLTSLFSVGSVLGTAVAGQTRKLRTGLLSLRSPCLGFCAHHPPSCPHPGRSHTHAASGPLFARWSSRLSGSTSWLSVVLLSRASLPVASGHVPRTDRQYLAFVALDGRPSHLIFCCRCVNSVPSLCCYIFKWQFGKIPEVLCHTCHFSSQDSLHWTFLLNLSLLGTSFSSETKYSLIHSLCLSWAHLPWLFCL